MTNQFSSVKEYNILYSRVEYNLQNLTIKYNLKVGNFSTHSMRKTSGRDVFNKTGTNAELAIVKLSQIFNHSPVVFWNRFDVPFFIDNFG